MEQSFDLICAQKHPELIDECIDLLNTQWPRSKTARLVSIQQGSSEGFPTTLLLINTHSNDDPKRVVAHCKVSPVSVYHPSACFVESVVVAKELRGKGIGRIIMDKMEAYVKWGIRIIYLTTHDQQGFYEKLGYSLCEPVVVYGGKCSSFKMDGGKTPFSSQHIRPAGTVQHKTTIEDNIKTMDESEVLSSMMTQKATLIENPKDNKNNIANKNVTEVIKSVPSSPPPPPPPPLNNLAISHSRKLTKTDIVLKPEMKVTMKKELLF
ncbi:N-alpha-acetyltransferase 80 isoform X2 [Folsomia candida]|uniref:N-alpha-acetyltransferase 80 isoform X2 n=1 Tax=Folsomia candida TaxID=158441 RepID=UPI000B8F88C8|nr:N-alpha-acetyltransferase 80 isoform X2 [Folsomia candida]